MSEIKIYNLRIVPPDTVFNEIMGFKKQFEAVFGKQTLSKSKPHLTLATFAMSSQHQGILLKAFDQLSSIEKFKLDIQGFGIFERYSYVLHLNVPKTEEIEQIHALIKILWVRDLHRKPGSLKVSDTPHITISKTDGKKMLYESLTFFQETGYSKRIAVNQLTLVSRYEGKTWDYEHQIELSSKAQ